jgi:hypothetical protein
LGPVDVRSVATMRAAVDAGSRLSTWRPATVRERGRAGLRRGLRRARARRRARLDQVLLLAPDAAGVYSAFREPGGACAACASRPSTFFLHGMLPAAWQGDVRGTPVELFESAVRPAFERLVAEGKTRAWGVARSACRTPSSGAQLRAATVRGPVHRESSRVPGLRRYEARLGNGRSSVWPTRTASR